MVEGTGSLQIRDAAEAYALTTPTGFAGTVDDQSGIISGGTFSTPTVSFEQEITTPLRATVLIDATFSEVAPGTVTGAVDPDGNVLLQTRLTVDLDIEVVPAGETQPLPFPGECRTTPVEITLGSTAPYGPVGPEGRVTVADPDFTVPPVVATPQCHDILVGPINEQLAGPGHALAMTLQGDLPVPPDAPCATTTALAVDPAAGSRIDDEVTLTATVTVDEPRDPECVAKSTGVDLSGPVDLLDGSTTLDTVTLAPDGTASLTTSALPSGVRLLTARYRGTPPYARSSSAVTEHRVAPDPTITSSLPELAALGGEGVELDLIVGNSQGGAAVVAPGIEVRLARPNASPSLGPAGSGIALEHRVGDIWTDVPLTFTGSTATGSFRDEAWAPLDPGETITIRLRLSAAPTMAAGRVNATFTLVDHPDGGQPEALATSQSSTTFLETDRRPSTVAVGNAFIPGRVVPTVIRQGNLFGLRNINVGPNTPGLGVPSGLLEFTIDGRKVPARAIDQPLADGFTWTVRANAANVQIQMPVDARPGPSTIGVRYLGNDHYLPGQTSVTIDVEPSLGPIFECTTELAGVAARLNLNLIGLASLPSLAPNGAQVPVANMVVRAVFDRGFTAQRFATSFPLGASTVGAGTLAGIDLQLGPEGAGSATGFMTSNNTLMTAAGDPDMVVDMTGESGSVTIAGAPGEVVPVTLEGLTLRFNDPIASLPYRVECAPVGEPHRLGQVTVAGSTLAVDAPTPTRARDVVTLTAEVFPPRGSVEFFDGDTSLGVAPVVAGRATLATRDLAVGSRTIVARHIGDTVVGSSTAEAALVVLPTHDCPGFAEEGSGAVVRLVYLELLGRCPDQVGFDFWVDRLDGGTSPEVFARVISRTPEAVGRVVDDAYVTMLGRGADVSGRAFWVGRMISGEGRYDGLLADLAGSSEFRSGAGATDVGFVTRVYDRLLGRAPDAAGLAYWTGRLGSGVSPRALVVSLANADEPLGRLVGSSYAAMLDRAPFAGERSAGITFLRSTGDRSGLYAQLIGRPEFSTRAQGLPNP